AVALVLLQPEIGTEIHLLETQIMRLQLRSFQIPAQTMSSLFQITDDQKPPIPILPPPSAILIEAMASNPLL
ncbi:hypothetical protein U1Q18_019468, partial [Sarracenia purpurea var. burkii]